VAGQRRPADRAGREAAQDLRAPGTSSRRRGPSDQPLRGRRHQHRRRRTRSTGRHQRRVRRQRRRTTSTRSDRTSMPRRRGQRADEAFDGGTPLAVLTYLARSLSNEPDAVVIDTEERRGGCASACTWRPTTWDGSSAAGAGRPRPSARWSTWPAPRTASRPAWTSSTTDLCSKSAGSPRPTACAARSSSSCGPT
jgi:hypothetical protein